MLVRCGWGAFAPPPSSPNGLIGIGLDFILDRLFADTSKCRVLIQFGSLHYFRKHRIVAEIQLMNERCIEQCPMNLIEDALLLGYDRQPQCLERAQRKIRIALVFNAVTASPSGDVFPQVISYVCGSRVGFRKPGVF